MIEEMKEELNKYILNLWIESLNVVKMSHLSKLMYSFNTTPIKILASFFVDINNLTPKFL